MGAGHLDPSGEVLGCHTVSAHLMIGAPEPSFPLTRPSHADTLPDIILFVRLAGTMSLLLKTIHKIHQVWASQTTPLSVVIIQR